MARPIKCRKVEFLPSTTSFVPLGKDEEETKAINLKVEELEAMRLKDIEGLTQQECAEEMGISRQTFQNIIDSGRKKVAQALIEGRGINIKGGNYVFAHCRLKCKSCNKTYEVDLIRDKDTCPTCHSHKVVCKNKGAKCKELCIK
ncbi:DUF134 domain-containing protein [Clostridium sp. Cult3]|uniref:DUF134 domain-containing protein n=1 Tax=Clostridium sp. Cult3 TaxID=2079004 RepID=UPI001F167C32|nr:DUF134 domain-containing protein [Clostridium sp. Cult3]MCF6460888.1 hypothetical protein [Clostridium sp. Cult3]